MQSIDAYGEESCRFMFRSGNRCTLERDAHYHDATGEVVYPLPEPGGPIFMGEEL